MTTPFKIYHITPNYRRVTFWTADENSRRVSVRNVIPNTGLTRQERYDIIAAALTDEGLEVPAYQET